MGLPPQSEGITIDFDCQFKVHLQDSRISTILAAFAVLLPKLLKDFFQKVLVGFGEYSMALKKKPFVCKCGNDANFIWKTRHGKKTKIHGFYRWLELHQLQVQCKHCGSKMYITRKLLGMAPKKRIAPEIYRKLGLLGSLTTFRVAEKIGCMFGCHKTIRGYAPANRAAFFHLFAIPGRHQQGVSEFPCVRLIEPSPIS